MNTMRIQLVLAAFIMSAASCNRTSNFVTAPLSVYSSGESISAEGSWRKAAGTRTANPQPYTVRIRCNTHTLECTEDGAWIASVNGAPFLQLLPTIEYRVVSWHDGVLLAEHEYSNSDCTLRISLTDKRASRTSRGTRARGMDFEADKWLEEVLQ
jgi:hypothetical protein